MWIYALGLALIVIIWLAISPDGGRRYPPDEGEAKFQKELKERQERYKRHANRKAEEDRERYEREWIEKYKAEHQHFYEDDDDDDEDEDEEKKK